MLAAVKCGGNKAVLRSRADFKGINIPAAAAATYSFQLYKLIFRAKAVYSPSARKIILNRMLYKLVHYTTLP